MGSVIFSTIGQAVAGPLGGAAGAMAGSAFDSALGGRNRRYRVPEFRAPTSAYGDPVPEIFGVSRVSGVLIWALPFARSGRTKGGSSDRSAYTASFAIALSARPIDRVGRVWADGRLIRSADGVFGLDCTMRVHRGVADQEVDPLIVAAEGLATCPAYRRLAYVVFEDFSLATFGNRIPALSFEVIADAGEPAADKWFEEHLRRSGLSGARCEASVVLRGFAALGPTARDDAQALGDFLRIQPAASGEGVQVRRSGRVWTIPEEELGARRPTEAGADGPKPRTAAFSERVAATVVSYLDPDRDYQRGSQQFGASAASRVLDLSGPFTATSADALACARTAYLDATAAVERLELALSWEWLAVAPNDIVQVAGDRRVWRVVERLVEAALVRLRCEAIAEPPDAPLASDPGRLLPPPVERIVPTRLVVVEPPVGWAAADGPSLQLFALAAEGWNEASIGWAADGDDQFAPAGALRFGVASGALLAPLAEGPATVWDEANRMVLRVDAGADDLVSRSMLAIVNGANLIRVGDELIQFRVARLVEDDHYILEGLLRGRLGTRPEAHPAGRAWHLVVPWAAVSLAVQPGWVGKVIQLQAAGTGDPVGGTLLQHPIAGSGSAPLAPCHVRLERGGHAGLRIRWTARDRATADWSGTTPPDLRWYRILLRWNGASVPQPYPLRIVGDQLDLPAEVTGEIMAAGGRVWCEILAEGDGPAILRSTGERELAV